MCFLVFFIETWAEEDPITDNMLHNREDKLAWFKGMGMPKSFASTNDKGNIY